MGVPGEQKTMRSRPWNLCDDPTLQMWKLRLGQPVTSLKPHMREQQGWQFKEQRVHAAGAVLCPGRGRRASGQPSGQSSRA